MNQIKKYSLALVIAALVFIEVIGAVQYFMAQHGAKQEVLAKAQRDMQESQRVAVVRSEVETALKNAERSVRVSLGSPETSYAVASRIILVNPHIIGVGVAFVPNYYQDKGKNGLYLPYTYDDQPSIVSKGKRSGKTHMQIRISDFDYTQRDWYKTAMAGQYQWTNPGLCEWGINVLTCTYSIPIKDKNGRIVAVLFADVTMADATVLMNDMDTSIRKSGVITFAMQIISLLLMAFIIWRAIKASRRYKEQFVDPEKEHLIEQLAKLHEVNGRLTKRNQDLAEKVAELQRRIQAGPQQTDQHWFG